jgi:nitric oxide reductase activation protein
MLGNEIGQMRLPFNPAGYCVHAEYRDDNSHLWLPAEDAFVSSTPLESVQPKVEDTPVSGPAPEISASAITQPTQPAGLSKFSYPEWDYRTGFYRPNWCQVYAGFAPLLDMAQSFEEQPLTQLWQKWLNHRQSELRRSHRREYEGDVFHTNGLIDAHINQRMGQQIDMRVYRRLDWEHQITSVLFLIDLSVSTGQALLQRHANAALYCAERLVQQGHACAVWGFRSWGRADVEVLWLKSWQEAMSSPQVKIRMARLRCGGSTRLGAVLRHAIHMLSIRHATAEMIILGDGEAHDIDVHDSRYLKRDFIQACREAKLKGHQVLRYHDGNLY